MKNEYEIKVSALRECYKAHNEFGGRDYALEQVYKRAADENMSSAMIEEALAFLA